jgi:hypothetical protein
VGEDKYQHVRFPHDKQKQLTRYICIPPHLAWFNEQEFMREIFPPEVMASDDWMQLTRRVILAPTNRIVDRINAEIAALMPADRPSKTYLSANKATDVDLYDPHSAIFAPENLQSINSAKLPPHELQLKVGMPVMCMKNLDVPNGICNGTIMIVERVDEAVVWCRVNTRFGQRLQPIVATHFAYRKGGFKFTRTQLPLRVAFSATINRAQGGRTTMWESMPCILCGHTVSSILPSRESHPPEGCASSATLP